MALWSFKAKSGVWWINEIQGRFHAGLGDESLGSYITAEQALDDLLGGHTFWPSSGADSSEEGLPDDLSEWERS